MDPQKRIALDVMGGDNAPRAILEGALLACASEQDQVPAERLLLVGDEEVIRKELTALDAADRFQTMHAPEVVAMDESPAAALRSKPKSSIALCAGAVKQGAAGASVSMGNTGAVVGASTLGLGSLPGVRRAGIAVSLDLDGHPVTLLDMGANIAPKPQHLAQYGVMGSVLMHDVLGVDKPRVGLLNIGEESSKGTDLMKEAHKLMTEAPVNFAGNVEGNDIFAGKADVVVCDGFTGNVVLKLLEGFAGFMFGLVLKELKEHQAGWGPEVLSHLKQRIDYSEYGGALLLGVNGTVVIGHGRSDAKAVANALGLAARAMDKDVNAHIVNGLSRDSVDA